uniref:Phosphatidylethanolamine-binding protein n=1 Tax=Fibrocapsa japonica TaxID=94617 RepID=A0A7S2XZZ8_9STRA|mmetsp:Transcript_4268/g.6383  ORF Transcript_4268/g.6383 Transcript_4268/m.6383 type:complete len:194 (+) Transcript_4268:79-660(+)
MRKSAKPMQLKLRTASLIHAAATLFTWSLCFSAMQCSLEIPGITDVVDEFTPEFDITLKYGPDEVYNGQEMRPYEAAAEPFLSFPGEAGELYTIIMVDPDAPSPENPRYGEWLHWIVSNVPGGKNSAAGDTVMEYMGPSPPYGKHRYEFFVFKQNGYMHLDTPSTRAQFKTRSYALKFGLGHPIAGMFFYSQK